MHFNSLDLLLWALSFAEQLALLLVLTWKRRFKQLPVFTLLILFNVLRTIALFCIKRYGSHPAYFRAFWSMAIVDVLLQLGLIYEFSSKVFSPLGIWAKDMLKPLKILLSGSFLSALALTLLPTPPTKFRFQLPILKGGFFSSALVSELCVGILVLSVVTGLTFSDHLAAVIEGFAVYSIFTVATETLNTLMGLRQVGPVYEALSHIRIIVWLSCVAYWIFALSRNLRPTKKMSEEMRQQVALIRRIVDKRISKLRTDEGL